MNPVPTPMPGVFPCPADYYCKFEVTPNFPQNHIYTMQMLEIGIIAVAVVAVICALMWFILQLRDR